MADLRQSEAYARYIKKLAWQVFQIPNPPTSPELRRAGKSQIPINIFVRRFGVFGAIAKIQRVGLPSEWDGINKILKKNRVWMCKLEPLGSNIHDLPSGFHQDGWPLLSTKTIRIDLSPSLDKIMAEFKKDCRYCLRKALNAQRTVLKKDFGGFYELWKKAAKIKHLWVPPKWQYEALIKSFGDRAFCITINDLAGAVVLMHDRTAYYYYAACLPAGKPLHLPYLVVWEGMKRAKKMGCKIWDFEGIYDHRWPNKNIKGYSHFKKSFGGEEVEFPGSFTRWL